MSVVIHMDAHDFERLLKASAGRAAMTIDPGRFEVDRGGELNPEWGWSTIYWLGHDYAAVILARAYLEGGGYLCIVAWDSAGPVLDGPRGWCILSNYNEHPSVRDANPLSRAARPDRG